MRRRPLIAALATITLLVAGATAHAADVRVVADLLKARYGLQSTPNCTSQDFTLTASVAQKLLSYDPSRIWMLVTDDATGICYWSHSAGVASNSGHGIQSNGGYVQMDAIDDFIQPTLEFWANCTVTTTNVHVDACDLNQ